MKLNEYINNSNFTFNVHSKPATIHSNNKNDYYSCYNENNNSSTKATASKTYQPIYSYTPTKQQSTSPSQFLYNGHNHSHPHPHHHSSNSLEDETHENSSNNEEEQLLIKINPLATRNTPKSAHHLYQQQQYSNYGITNEETRRLTGVVAKTRALFESTLSTSYNKVRSNKSTGALAGAEAARVQSKPINKSVSVSGLRTVVLNSNQNSLNATLASEIDSAKSLNEKRPTATTSSISNSFQLALNSAQFRQKVEIVNNNSSSLSSSVSSGSLSQNLWDKSEEAFRELSIPKSVREARLCFEKLTSAANASAKASGSYSRLSKSQILPLSSQRTQAAETAQQGVSVIVFIQKFFYFFSRMQ